jgi:hypothetical protein
VRIIIGIVLLLFIVLWVRAVIDVFRRHDLSGGGKAGWTIFMLILPFIGLLVYTMLRPANA